jgi:hypothetical protein
MSNKILFSTGLPAKTRLRINGQGIHQYTTKIPKFKNSSKALITSSDFAKENKIMLYPDVVASGETKITIINLTPYPVDLEQNDHIGTLVPLPTQCDCNNKED